MNRNPAPLELRLPKGSEAQSAMLAELKLPDENDSRLAMDVVFDHLGGRIPFELACERLVEAGMHVVRLAGRIDAHIYRQAFARRTAAREQAAA